MRAIYAFSGDPVTYGHIDIVHRAANTYDEVVVAIGENPQKAGKYLFSREERLALAKQSLAVLPNVTCVAFRGLLAEYAFRNGFDVIIRGVRNNSDLEMELVQFAVNESLHPRLDMVFFPARGRLAHISSGVVKAIVAEGGDVSAYCPLAVKEALERRILGRFTVGVAGGIAAGKTFFSERLIKALDAAGVTATHISLDRIGHYVLGTAPEHIYETTRRRIADRFGQQVRLPDGAIDRQRLGRIVFADAHALDELNELMREPILAKLYEETRNLPNGVVVVLEGAILVEGGWTNLVNNNLILVDAPDDARHRRLTKRGAISDEEARTKIDRQISADQRRTIIEERIRRDRWGRIWQVDGCDSDAHTKAIAAAVATLATDRVDALDDRE